MEVALVPVSAESLDAELTSDLARLAAILGVTVDEWPPVDGDWDLEAVRHFRAVADSPSVDVRLGPFYVISAGALVASAGFFGPPDQASEVEIGYSVCARHQRRGLATSTIAELCRRAELFGAASVRARVRPDNVGSLRALERNGFVGDDGAPADELVVLRRGVG